MRLFSGTKLSARAWATNSLRRQTLIDAIAEHPLRYPVVRRNTRRALLRRFPYAMYFRIYDDVIVVVACMHGRRNPRRWQLRA
jgi:plasmid stabilization system protein ParE